jgi:ATP-dependent DNA helicase RecG
VVIDEQHRFGVEQRAALRDKAGGGPVPDVLVMTATPIPRTAAMTVYGDLDVTVIRSLPRVASPIVTTWARSDDARTRCGTRCGARSTPVARPTWCARLIEESEKLEARAAEDTYAQLEAVDLKGLRLGLLHGRLGSADKDATMHQFRERRLDVLVATTASRWRRRAQRHGHGHPRRRPLRHRPAPPARGAGWAGAASGRGATW